MDVSDSEDPAPKRPRVGEPKEEEISHILSGLINHDSSVAQRRQSKFHFREGLRNFVRGICTSDDSGMHACGIESGRIRQMPRLSLTHEHPEPSHSRFLNTHTPQVLRYLSIHPEKTPEGRASTCEVLEASRFEFDSGIETPHLKFFRMAQKIRDEYGISREDSSLACFTSFEDIKRLEGKIANKDPEDFLVQCLLLAEDMCPANMYPCLETFSQLASFHEMSHRLGRLDDHCTQSYAQQFEQLMMAGMTPPWQLLEKYLEQSEELVYLPKTSTYAVETLIGVDIPFKKIDAALRRILDYLLRCFGLICCERIHDVRGAGGITATETEAAVRVLRLLLDRGAELHYREPHDILNCEQSSLGALIELADVVPTFPLEKFLPYICCPLVVTDDELQADGSRPARLSCLAARSVGASEKLSRVPNNYRPWIRMHQELRLRLADESWRFAAIRERVLTSSADSSEDSQLTSIRDLTDWRVEFYDEFNDDIYGGDSDDSDE